VPRLVALKDLRWTGKRAWIWNEEKQDLGADVSGDIYVAIDGITPRGLTGRAEGTKERWFFRSEGDVELNDMFDPPGLPAKVLRICVRCKHEECPGCEGSCDVLEHVEDDEGSAIDADVCCDGECTYDDHGRLMGPFLFLARREGP
jgi:hypothetical protein